MPNYIPAPPNPAWSTLVLGGPTIVEDRTDGQRQSMLFATCDGVSRHYTGTLPNAPIQKNSVAVYISGGLSTWSPDAPSLGGDHGSVEYGTTGDSTFRSSSDTSGYLIFAGSLDSVPGNVIIDFPGPVSTTIAAAITSTGVQTVTPGSMTNIIPGCTVKVGSDKVEVTAVTGTTFTANFHSTQPANSAVSAPDQLPPNGAVITLYFASKTASSLVPTVNAGNLVSPWTSLTACPQCVIGPMTQAKRWVEIGYPQMQDGMSHWLVLRGFPSTGLPSGATVQGFVMAIKGDNSPATICGAGSGQVGNWGIVIGNQIYAFGTGHASESTPEAFPWQGPWALAGSVILSSTFLTTVQPSSLVAIPTAAQVNDASGGFGVAINGCLPFSCASDYYPGPLTNPDSVTLKVQDVQIGVYFTWSGSVETVQVGGALAGCGGGFTLPQEPGWFTVSDILTGTGPDS